MIPPKPTRRQALMADNAGVDEPTGSDGIQVELAAAWRAAEDEATRAYLQALPHLLTNMVEPPLSLNGLCPM